MVRCWKEPGQGGKSSHFKFQLIQRIEIDLTKREDIAPSCSCKTVVEGRACKHIWWLTDHIIKANGGDNRELLNIFRMDRSGALGSVLQNGAAETSFSIWGIIDRLGLDVVAARRRWVYGDEEEARETIAEHMNDMLSIFDPSDRLPHEFAELQVHDQPRDTDEYASSPLYPLHRFPTIHSPKLTPPDSTVSTPTP